jgi:hypothetical protein
MRQGSRRTFILVIAAQIGAGCASISEPTRFTAPEAAVESLIVALRARDMDRLQEILGTDPDGLLSSGDPVADRNNVAQFLAAYDARHRIVDDPAGGGRTLLVGPSDWPMPIPLVPTGGRWSFDVAAGREEIRARRIGRNELAAIQTCLAIADAQREYAHSDPDGDGVADYAEKVVSDPGRRDGLYWPVQAGERESPLGPLVVAALAEGYEPADPGSSAARPFHGYYYKLLRSQGPNAEGGALDYVVNGRRIGGFAVVAWPAVYGTSGIMTFMVNHAGVVFENDLGEDTPDVAKAMTEFDPGPGWTRVD